MRKKWRPCFGRLHKVLNLRLILFTLLIPDGATVVRVQTLENPHCRPRKNISLRTLGKFGSQLVITRTCHGP